MTNCSPSVRPNVDTYGQSGQTVVVMISEMGGQLNNILHSSTTVCDVTRKIFLKHLVTANCNDHGSMDMRACHNIEQATVYNVGNKQHNT